MRRVGFDIDVALFSAVWKEFVGDQINIHSAWKVVLLELITFLKENKHGAMIGCRL